MSDARRVVVTGATGLIGRKVCARLREKEYQVVVFSRNPQKARQSVPGAAEYVEWSADDPQGSWVGALYGVYGVVHLAGASIFGKRWTADYKKTLYESRINTTRMLVDAIGKLEARPEVLVSGSAVGYYGFRGDEHLDEIASSGKDFLARLTADWENEARRAETYGLRVAEVRTGIVLDDQEGALPLMKMPFQFLIGGPILPGSQWISWVHIDDEVDIVLLALENQHVRGPINATAPEPQRNTDFMKALGQVMGTPSWLPVPGFGLKMLLGEFADNLTHGQRVIPQKALDLGYEFHYPTLPEALTHLLKKR